MTTQLQFITCPQCAGNGAVNGKRCEVCRGFGIYGYIEGNFLFYSKPFNLKNFWQEKLKIIFKKTVNIFLLILGIAGILILISTLFQLEIFQTQLSFSDLLNQKNELVLLFWFSLLGDMYLLYHIERDARWQHRKIISYIATSPYNELLNFPDVLKVKNKFKIEVAESFSEHAETILWRSWRLAYKLRHSQVTPLHLFASLLMHSKVKKILTRLEVDLYALKSKVRYQLSLIKSQNEEPIISSELNKIILNAYFIAYRQDKSRLGSFELLIAIAEQDSLAKEMLYDLEIDLEKVKNVVAWIGFDDDLFKIRKKFKSRAIFKPKGVMNRAFTAVATPFLDQCSQDLTYLAKSGYFSLCVRRDKEIKQIFQSLESRNSGFVLVGESGTGKISIIEGIAQLMVEEEVPEILKDKRLISLDLGSLVGGGEMNVETKLKIIINEVIRAGNIVLFIDNIANIVGVRSGNGELDIADIISSYTKQKFLILLSTCSAEDYQRVLKNSSLNNALEKIEIAEPTGSHAIQILESKISAFEGHYGVFFSYEAVSKAVELSSRYLPDKFLPEKGITLLEEAGVYVRQIRGKKALVKKEDIAYLVSHKTKIPLTKITEKESVKLLNLEVKIHQRIIGQAEAVKAVSTALRRARTELRELKKPIASLLFLGPTGVGKTELAKAISDIYFGSESNMIRLDMSEYQEKNSLDRLLGAPYGYEGAERGGYLTEAVKKQPFSLLLLDEIEKAHKDVLNLFLQVMEDGRLTDNKGKTVDFSNVILIGTSNACSNFIQEEIRRGINIEQIKNDLLTQELKSYFLPEFLNRFDEILVFKPLTQEEIKQIAYLLLIKLQKQLGEKGITLQATDEAIEELSQAGFDPVFGARPLKRVIQDRINNALANYLLKGQLKRRDVAVLEKGGEIRVVKGKEL